MPSSDIGHGAIVRPNTIDAKPATEQTTAIIAGIKTNPTQSLNSLIVMSAPLRIPRQCS